jgi:tRNA/tmRNA/rRNA uracil-C5-methylase (TrmA/RlmC/RlmD family)
MKKGQIYEGTVERVDFPNKGKVISGEETCTVKNVLPGQKVSFRVIKTRNGKAEGKLVEVIKKSQLETRQACTCFGVCGGCAYLTLSYEEQLRLKEEQVRILLERALRNQAASWQWEGIKGSPCVTGYRNKMEFSFGDDRKDGPLTLGLHKRGSFYDVVNLEDCQIIDGDYQLILDTVGEYFRERQVSYYHRMRRTGYLRHLLVRKAAKTGEILVGLVTTGGRNEVIGASVSEPENAVSDYAVSNGSIPDELVSDEYVTDISVNCNSSMGDNITKKSELLEGFLKELLYLETDGKLSGKIVGILHIINDSSADAIRNEHVEVLYGRDSFVEELLGLTFEVSAFSFFQTNTYGAEVLYQTVREYAGECLANQGNKILDGTECTDQGNQDEWEMNTCDDNCESPKITQLMKNRTIFDLYCGTGTITQLMSPMAEQVIGVELVEEAVEAARISAERNGLQNCQFIAGDVLHVLDTLTEKPDLIILDPPRDGIHPKALPKLLAYQVDHFIYVSCKPTSLARDLEVFLVNGYQVDKAVAVDQFPWTNSVETVVLISRRKNN